MSTTWARDRVCSIQAQFACKHSKHRGAITMNPEQIMLVQASFVLVMPIADTAAALFYQRLFELDPSLRPMFRGDIREQGRKLMTMLKLAVNGLTRLDQLV